jgi:uncharacterized damage-inducible protein DinB
MSMTLIRELWSYHHWANRRLFDAAAALGEETAGREIGPQFSMPTLRGMFVHLYGADRLWLKRWKGEAAPAAGPTYGLEITTLAELRRPWDALVSEQRAFLHDLADADLSRLFEAKSPDGMVVPRPFGMMLLHVPNHATHHRSEIATMLTIVSGSPPETGINTYYWEHAKAQRAPA